MAKTASADQDSVAAAEIKLSLHEFCARLSETVKRPELIGAFEHVERVADRNADTASAYQLRYDAFITKPV